MTYAAARQPIGRAPWAPPLSGANELIGRAWQTITARARDAVRNNAYARRVVDVWVANLIGTGVTTSWGDENLDRLWSAWTASVDIDAQGSLNWPGLQALAARALVESGEALIWFRRAPVSDDNPVGLRLLVLEGDVLDWTKNGEHQGRRVIQGIEVDGELRPVAYWITREEGMRLRTERIPAAEIIHLYRRERPGQLRAVSWLAAILWHLRDLHDYEQALLRKAYVEACLALIVNNEDDGTVTGGVLKDASGQPVEQLEPQMILYRNGPGTVEVVNPTGGGSHVEFAKRTLEAVAIGTGLTYDQVSGDLTKANYSSLRAGKLEYRALLAQLQNTIIIPFIDRVARRFWTQLVSLGLARGPYPANRVRHVPVAPGMIDPVSETEAMIRQIRAGLLSPQQAAGRLGNDFAEIIQQIAAANALVDDLGVVLDSDARRVSKTGAAHEPAHIAAVEIGATGSALEDRNEE